MPTTFEELPGWTFVIEEVSAGVYKALGMDEAGRSVEMSGLDPEAMLEECKKRVVNMLASERT